MPVISRSIRSQISGESVRMEGEGPEDEQSTPNQLFHLVGNKPEASTSQGTQLSVEMKDARSQSAIVNQKAGKCHVKQVMSSQTEDCDLIKQIKALESQQQQLKAKLSALREARANPPHPLVAFEEKVTSNDKICQFYTGLKVQQFKALKEFGTAENINYWGGVGSNIVQCTDGSSSSVQRQSLKFTQGQELLLMLLTLRGGLLLQDMAYQFLLSTTFIYGIVLTWVNVLYTKFNSVRSVMFPCRDIIERHLPNQFRKEEFKNLRVIVDCFEVQCEKPNENAGDESCLRDETPTSLKFLIGCTPNGAISFVSDAMEGSKPNCEVLECSGLMELLEEGDLVLAGRGFPFHDCLGKGGEVSRKLLAFFKSCDKLVPIEVEATEDVAANKILVSIASRLERFRIFQIPVPHSMSLCLPQAVFICACLLNFREPLLSQVQKTFKNFIS